MKLEQFQEVFKSTYDRYLGIVIDVLKQIIGKELKADFSISEIENLEADASGFEFPAVSVRLVINDGVKYDCIFLIKKDFGLMLHSMLLGGMDVGDKLNEEVCDGIKEIVNQVVGQVKINAGEEGGFDVSEAEVKIVESPGDLKDVKPGLSNFRVLYNVTIDSNSSEVYHYVLYREEKKAEAEKEEVAGPEVEVEKADFQSLTAEKAEEKPANMDVLMDVELEVVVELGKKMLPIRDILKLGKGSVIELEKAAGEPLDIYVNGRKFAEGEVVVVDDSFGIRITQFVVNHRLKK